ncbi:MAG: DUF2304 domain-containing protein [Acidobacteria bacterium]|nr:DUF2304 domain-containing protein [Acidobacteriota bacterium]
MERLLLVTALASIALIFQVMYSLRRDRIRVEYSISWLAAASIMLFLSRWPTGLEWLAATAGITYPPAVLLAMVVALLLMVLYRLSAVISHLRDNNVELAQKVAILEFRINQIAGHADRR